MANQSAAGFDDKLLARLSKLDPAQLREYVSRLISQKQFFLSIFDQLHEGVIVAEAQLRIQYINRRARQMLGWPRGRNYAGEKIGELIAAGHPLFALFTDLAQNPKNIEGIECPFGRKLDHLLSLTAHAVPPAEGASSSTSEPAEPRTIILLTDITERRRRMNEQARARRLASLSTLTSGIAHEIKNPLNSMNIHAQLLQAEAEEARRERRGVNVEKAMRATDVILEETARLGRVIEEFLQAARPRSPKLELTSLQGLFDRAERLFCPECDRAGITLSIACETDVPPLMCDEHLLLQALRNLVRNSVEALIEKTERLRADGAEFEPWLRVSAELAGDHVNIRVADNGSGIPENVVEHVFEPYFTTKFNGTGLGLMVVYRIVTEHRGTLHIDTQPGEGTAFIISLPLHQRPVRLLERDAADRKLLEHEAPHVPARR